MLAARESFLAIGDRWFLSTVLADLPRPAYVQGRYDDAWTFVRNIDEVPAVADAEWRIKRQGVHACLLARAGRFKEAEGRVREGVEVAAQTDQLWFHADVLMDLVEILRLAGRPREAAEAAGEALALYERKGIVPYERRTRAVLEEFRAQAVI
jgi:hypothetical protein